MFGNEMFVEKSYYNISITTLEERFSHKEQLFTVIEFSMIPFKHC